MTGLRYLLDTNILVFLLRTRPLPLVRRLEQEEGRIAVSMITVAELHYGVERSSKPAENRAATEALLALVEELEFDRVAAEHAAHIRAVLAKNGTPIGGYDVLIAGQARSRGLAVVTNNHAEFDRVPGLLVEDWMAGER